MFKRNGSGFHGRGERAGSPVSWWRYLDAREYNYDEVSDNLEGVLVQSAGM